MTFGSAFADNPTGVEEKTGDYIPMEAMFTDDSGVDVSLGSIIDRPALLLPVYYTCPRICSFDMANLALALQQTSVPYGDFRVITMSFNSAETPQHGAKSKKNYTAMLAGEFSTENWSFLTGSETEIRKVTEAIGYSYKPVEGGLFIHPSAMVALAADGKIIKYVYGSFLVGDVDLALTEAKSGTPAVSIKRFLAYCLSGDIKRNKTVFLLLKSAVIFLVAVGAFILFRILRRGEEKG